MSLTFARRSYGSGRHIIVALLPQRLTRRTSLMHAGAPVSLSQEQVQLVADRFVAVMRIWHVENCLEIKAHIACWHRQLTLYRGYLLCSDSRGRTFLIDTRTSTYLTITSARLLQIDGVQQTKTFVDALCPLHHHARSAA